MHRSPKEVGEYIEDDTLARFEMVEPVDATDWYDGIVVENTPCLRVLDATDVPTYLTDLLCLHVGDVVEVKAAQQRLASGARGRFYIRRRQHEKLVDADAVYAFVVYDEDGAEVLAVSFVPASEVSETLPDGWTDVSGSRAETGYRQLTWTHFVPIKSIDAAGGVTGE